MAAICGKRKKFFKLPRVHFLDTLWAENFNEITVSRTVKEIEANSGFAIFGKNSKITFFENCKQYISQIPCGLKLLTKSLYLACLRRSSNFVFFSIFGKNSKIQNGRHFWGGENFLKMTKSTFLRCRQNRSILHC